MTAYTRQIQDARKYFFILVLLFIPVLSALHICRTADAETVIQDDAGIISGNDENSLRSLCDKIYKKYKTSVYIWTDNGISGSDDFDHLMEQFVSARQETDVIILMVGMYPGDRIYEVQGYGTAQEMINNKRCSKILDYMYDDMAGGNYYNAIKTFCQKSYTYMGRPPLLDNPLFSPLIQLVICLATGIIVIVIIVYNSGGRTTTDSYTYLDQNNSRIIGHFDRYTHTTVTRTPKPKDTGGSSGGGGGGGGSHSSGGGRSF